MKKILTILVLALFTVTAASAQQTVKAIPAERLKSVMVYSADDDAIVYKQGSQQNGKEIIIESIPGFGTESVVVDIAQNENGSYTFTKHPSLLLPEYYTVIITDAVTGNQFDLKKSDSYTFDIAKQTPERFTLRMQKNKTSSPMR